MRETRKPQVGDRVALPGHALIFIVRSVDELAKTVDVDMTTEDWSIQKGVSWEMLTFIDP